MPLVPFTTAEWILFRAFKAAALPVGVHVARKALGALSRARRRRQRRTLK